MIVFDGLYSFVSIGLSGLAVLALGFVRRGPDERFPWGREAAEPLVVILKAATLGALCVYAAVGGIVDLLNGGREVEVGWAIVYALIATAGSLAVGLVLRYGTRSTSPEGAGADLVRAEAAEWLGDALLSVGVLVGFLAALLLTEEGRPDIAAYIDPAMVVLVSVAFLVVPFRLIIGGLREVLSMSPSEEIQAQLRACVDDVQRHYRLQESFVRAAKVGGRMDIEVDFVVGPIFSNILQAIHKPVTDNKTFLISPNAGPSSYAGKNCSPFFYVTSYQNDQVHEILGKVAQDRGYKRVYVMVPNYQAGKDSAAGFKLDYKGEIVEESYVPLGTLDFQVELSKIASLKPDAVFTFMPGGMGINFIKQYVAAGLSKDIQLIVPGFGADEDTIKAVGEPMLGLFNPAHWSPDLDNAESKRFVAAFEKEYGRIPSAYAAQGYDAALMMDGKTFDYKSNERLYKALQLKLFEDQKDTIKLTSLVSQVVDKDTQAKIDVVKSRLIRDFGYDDESATDVLNYVASIFARGDVKKK